MVNHCLLMALNIGTVVRPVLCERLETLTAESAVWIDAPPASGKSTLLLTYAQWRKGCTTYLQIGPGSDGVLSLMCELSRRVGMPASAIPICPTVPLAPTLIAELGNRFFTRLFAHMEPGSALLLDETERLLQTPAARLLECAISARPSCIRLVVASRPSPAGQGHPPRSDWIQWGADELRLQDDELVAAWPGASLPWLRALQGFPAGVAVLRALRERPAVPPNPLRAMAELVSQLLLETDPQALPGLAALSATDRFSVEDLARLPDRARVETTLSAWLRWGLVAPSQDGRFAYLFPVRARLQEWTSAERHTEEWHESLLASPEARPVRTGHMIVPSEDREYLSRQLGVVAPTLCAQGRGAQWLQRVFDTLGDVRVEDDPRLVLGWADLLKWDWPAETLVVLTRLNARLAEVGETEYIVRCCGAMADALCHLERRDEINAALVHDLISQLSALSKQELKAEWHLIVHGRLGKLYAHFPGHQYTMQSIVRCLLQALPRCDSAPDKLIAGTMVLRSVERVDMAYAAGALIETLAPLAERPEVPARPRTEWYLAVASRLAHVGRCNEARTALAQAVSLAKTVGIGLSGRDGQVRCRIALVERRLESADSELARLGDQSHRIQTFDLTGWHLLWAERHLLAGTLDEAHTAAQQAWHVLRERGDPDARSVCAETLALIHAGRGEFAESERWFETALQSSEVGPREGIALNRALIRVYKDIVSGNETAVRARLPPLLTAHRSRFCTSLLRVLPEIAAKLLDRALSYDVEPHHAQSLINAQRLQPPDCFNPRWPHDLSVRSFGALDLVRGGEAVFEKGKAQQKPQLLLGILLSAGPQGVEKSRLMRQLWPAGEVSSPVKALEITVHRLRKWLQVDGAIVIARGQVRLVDGVVWTDAAALSEFECYLGESLARLGLPMVQRAGRQLFSLYRGPFCSGIDHPVVNVARDRYRRQVAAMAEAIGTRLEQLSSTLAAEAIYGRALDIDPTAEALYRGLMRTARARGDSQAVAEAYERCQRVLKEKLGISPSAETERLVLDMELAA